MPVYSKQSRIAAWTSTAQPARASTAIALIMHLLQYCNVTTFSFVTALAGYRPKAMNFLELCAKHKEATSSIVVLRILHVEVCTQRCAGWAPDPKMKIRPYFAWAWGVAFHDGTIQGRQIEDVWRAAACEPHGADPFWHWL